MPSPPTPLTTRFREDLHQAPLWGKDDRLLVGISGGPDSVALAHLLWQEGLPMALAHVNYQLRGAESDADEVLVRQLAAMWDVSLFVHRCDTLAWARSRGLSIQMAAREIRYTWWDRLCREEGYTKILTGHQADDQVETILLYLLRGRLQAGWKAIPARRDNICRPLLGVNRDLIIHHLLENGLPWREDRSNQNAGYLRNFLRLDIIPRLRQKAGNLPDRIRRWVALNEESGKAVDWALAQAAARALHQTPDRLVIELLVLDAFPFAPHALRTWLAPLGFSESDLDALVRLRRDTTGQQFYSPHWQLVHERGRLMATRLEEVVSFEPYPFDPVPGAYATKWGTLYVSDRSLPDNLSVDSPRHAWVNPEALQGPLVLRLWQAGDRIQPFGMKGHKKVQDLLTDLKWSRSQKQTALVLCDEQGIGWVPGVRLDARWRIPQGMAHALFMEWVPSEEPTLP